MSSLYSLKSNHKYIQIEVICINHPDRIKLKIYSDTVFSDKKILDIYWNHYTYFSIGPLQDEHRLWLPLSAFQRPLNLKNWMKMKQKINFTKLVFNEKKKNEKKSWSFLPSHADGSKVIFIKAFFSGLFLKNWRFNLVLPIFVIFLFCLIRKRQFS